MAERRKVTKEEFCKMLLYARGKRYSGVTIEGISVSGLDLSYMDLASTKFVNVDFTDTMCCGLEAENAVFVDCTLDKMVVMYSNLGNVRYFGCSMEKTEISNSSLLEARISNCIITQAIMKYDNLCNSHWYSNTITGVDFKGSMMVDADLDSNRVDGEITGAPPIICPEEGSFIAYKRVVNYLGRPVVAKLLIPEDAKRSSSTTRKCRASKAKVLEFYDHDRKRLPVSRIKYGYSAYDRGFRYERGKTVTPRAEFDTNRWHECAPGIHFFMTFEEAANYGR